MKLMIVGHARHGKDTVAELLQKKHRMKFVSSSWWCAENVMMPAFLKRAHDTPDASRTSGCAEFPYGSVKECFEDRHNHREFWHEKISEYCELDLAKMAREILDVNDIYVGCRSDREFLACQAQQVYDFAVWVDASRRLPQEPWSSMKIKQWMADYTLDNNGTLEQLAKGLDKLMVTMRTKGRR